MSSHPRVVSSEYVPVAGDKLLSYDNTGREAYTARKGFAMLLKNIDLEKIGFPEHSVSVRKDDNLVLITSDIEDMTLRKELISKVESYVQSGAIATSSMFSDIKYTEYDQDLKANTVLISAGHRIANKLGYSWLQVIDTDIGPVYALRAGAGCQFKDNVVEYLKTANVSGEDFKIVLKEVFVSVSENEKSDETTEVAHFPGCFETVWLGVRNDKTQILAEKFDDLDFKVVDVGKLRITQ